MHRHGHTKAGMWPFGSTRSLKKRSEPHTLQDDLESFVLVVLYMVLRYTNHNCKTCDLPTIMAAVFDSYVIWADDHTITGGYGKANMFRSRLFIGRDFRVSGNIPLNIWLNVALTAVKEWHEYLSHLDSQAATAATVADPFLLLPEPKSNPASNDSEKLKDHSMLLDFWGRALLHPQWPAGDGPQDHLVDYYKGGHSSRGPNLAGSTGK
ncbi:hypothetical protein Hypma_004783 [Hypsizygus marmoreus]|uniref:Fungal-type protein kinase domain-containing protein n=1 Tax=Hypsizygus marmoreus TaxID=39966 RepID=A0A369J6T1_HYPMA|nr:hypothetical protein Hypma_004783 [Hypsizygus marmoreus]